MTEINQINDDSIDLIKIFQLIWMDKWRIIAIISVFLISAFLYQQAQTVKYFSASTEIRPISSADEQKYISLNSYLSEFKPDQLDPFAINPSEENQLQGDFSNFYQINFELLQNLYIEQLKQPKIFEDAIIEFQLIDRKDFNNEESFNKAVIALALNIEIIEPPKINNRSDADNFPKFWEIKFSYTDEDKWKNILSSVHNDATGNVKKILQDRFNKTISITKQKKEFEIDDILYEINNALDDYEIQTTYLLVYLKEQAEIAKALGIAKSTIEAQMFSAQNGMLNIEFDTPFYLKGYEAIEKEIEIIKTRKIKEAFIEGFSEKDKKLRDLKQDKSIQRLEMIYQSTPIITGEDFVAAQLLVGATKFKYENNDLQVLAISAMIGGLLGIFYTIISNAFRERGQLS